MIRRPPRSTLSSSSAASDVYKRQVDHRRALGPVRRVRRVVGPAPHRHGDDLVRRALLGPRRGPPSRTGGDPTPSVRRLGPGPKAMDVAAEFGDGWVTI